MLSVRAHARSWSADVSSVGHRKIPRGQIFCSPEREKELGNKLTSEIENASKFVTDAEITTYVYKVAQRVERNSDKHMAISIKLIDSDEARSFTLPGGHQYITKGLLIQLQNEGELASAIARGIAHTALRSETTIATKSQLMQLATIPITNAGSSDSSAAGVPLIELKERRESELDADFFGVQYLYKAGYDTQCFLDFVELVGDSNKGVSASLSTYPPVAQRLQFLRKEIAEILPRRDGALVSTTEFQEFKNRIRALTPGIVPSEPMKKSN
jgi:beta-barrel assembly-enhancing protease